MDPFDGKPLRFKRLANGYMIYSIGRDLHDDGGKEEPPSTTGVAKTENYDITFTVER